MSSHYFTMCDPKYTMHRPKTGDYSHCISYKPAKSQPGAHTPILFSRETESNQLQLSLYMYYSCFGCFSLHGD